MEAALALAGALVNGIPKIIQLIRAGKRIEEIQLKDFVSKDALEIFHRSTTKVDDFVNNG